MLNIKNLNRTTIYLLPILELPSILKKSQIRAFIGNYSEPRDLIGKFIYVLFRRLSQEDLEILENTSRFVSATRYPDGDLAKFYLTKKEINEIVKPFMAGKYSEINKDYIKEKFNRFITVNNAIVRNPVHSVVFKSKQYRERLEQRLAIKLPESAELDSIPKLEQEIYLFNENSANNENIVMDNQSTS